jgi:hypothetical protein
MQHENIKRQDFYRARFLLKNRFNNVDDLLRYWSFSGPCNEDHPDIERIKNSQEFDI